MPCISAYEPASTSTMALLVAYGLRGPSGWLSSTGRNCGLPYSSPEQAMSVMASRASSRTASSRLSEVVTFEEITSAGASQERATDACAARCTTWSGFRRAIAARVASASARSTWS